MRKLGLLIILVYIMSLIACKQEPKSFVSWDIRGEMYNGSYILEAAADEIPGKAIGTKIEAYDTIPAKAIVTFEDRDKQWIVSMNLPADSAQIRLEKGSPFSFILTDTKLRRSLYPRGLYITFLSDSSAVNATPADSSLLNVSLRVEGEMFLRDSSGTEQIHQVKGEMRFVQPGKEN